MKRFVEGRMNCVGMNGNLVQKEKCACGVIAVISYPEVPSKEWTRSTCEYFTETDFP